MNTLLLLRHGKAAPHDAGLPDHSRPLTPGGRAAIRAVRDDLDRHQIGVDLVLVSSARRTLQTLQCLAPIVSPNRVEVMDALYLAGAADLLHVLRQVTPTLRAVLLIGHNPGLHELALHLTENRTHPDWARLQDAYPTAGLVHFTAAPDWDRIGPAAATLQRYVTTRTIEPAR